MSKQVLRIIGKHKFLLALSIILAAVSSVLQLYVPIIFGNAIDQVAAEHAVHFSSMEQYLVKILIFVIIAAISTWLMNLINNRLTYRTVQDVRAQAIRKIQNLPLSYLDSHSTGDTVQRVIADVDQLSDGLLLGLTQLFSGIVTIIATLAFMFSKNLEITLVVIVLTPVSFLVAKFIATRSYKMFSKQTETRGRQTALVNEMIGGEKVVKAFGYGSKASGRFTSVNKELQGYSEKAIFYSSLTNPSTRAVNNVIYAVVALIGAYRILGGALTVGGLTVLLAYANQYMKPFNDISSVITELQNAKACADRVYALIDADAESADPAADLCPGDGSVDIDHVYFSYNKEKKLIEDFNFHAAPGTTTAIVGPTGCGKTTFINLLMRFYDADQGTISIDEQPINSVSRTSVRRTYGMVLQETWLKNGTVRENIAFGRPDATDEEIIKAAKDSHSWEFIRRMPNGLDTPVCDESLSQGQKQLLCIKW